VSQKPIVWLGSSRHDLQAFPRDARRLAGFQLRQVQQGLNPTDFKPMSSIGPGIYEIRIHTAAEHRVCYVAKFAEAVYVLHAFSKRTRNTSRHDVTVATQRYQALLAQR
jgi:phage-related protein